VMIVVSIILPWIPILRWALIPFDYLNTHIHELFHAVACVATGGQVSTIKVFNDAQGVTTTYGGWGSLITSAGYVGASLFGSVLIQISTRAAPARTALRLTAFALLIGSIVWVRGDAIGWFFGFFWALLLILVTEKKDQQWITYVAQFVGVQQCVNGFKSLRDLFILTSAGSEQHDAAFMQAETGIPAIVWAIVWTGIGAFGVYRAFRTCKAFSAAGSD
jgi:hypothetical protein